MAGGDAKASQGLRRAAAAIALAAIVVGGLVAHGLPDSPASDIVGDALYAVAVYAGLVLLFARAPVAVIAAAAALWCTGIELFQLTGIPLALAAGFAPWALVFGTGFDPRDLVVALAAVIAVSAIDKVASGTVSRRRDGMHASDEGLDPT